MGGIRHSAKFILPLRAKTPSSLPLMLLAGHCLSQVTCPPSLPYDCLVFPLHAGNGSSNILAGKHR